MIKKIKTFILSFATLFVLSAPALVPASAAYAVDIQSNVCSGASNLAIGSSGNTNEPGPGSCTTDQTGKVNNIIATVLNVLSVVVGIIAVIMIIIGGYKYITSGGSSEKVTSAKNTLLYAIIGLIIVALAQIIVKFVLQKASST